MRTRYAALAATFLLLAAVAATLLLTAVAGAQPASDTPACENGTVAPQPIKPGLVADCDVPAAVDEPKRVTNPDLSGDSLNGSIPAVLSALSALRELRLALNQWTGTFPSQLEDLRRLLKLYLKDNSELTGCVPRDLHDARDNDLARLNLTECAPDAPDTSTTPLPTYSLTVTAGVGGSLDPAGTTTHAEASEVTLTASWSDATHTFAGWGADCSGTATTCMLTMYTGKTVTASFTALAADRCATATNADCIRAVYLGAPDDYAQVQDIPADLLLSPDANGRYEVERGVQVTVVTAAPLPSGYTRFYLQRHPLQVTVSPTSYERLILPVGTTYTFTPIEFEGAADELSFDLRAAKPPLRPGLRPQLGLVMVTVIFHIQSPPIAPVPSELTNSYYNGPALEPGTHQFPTLRHNDGPLIIHIPTSTHRIKWAGLILNEVGGLTYCLADMAQLSVLCFDPDDASESYRFISPSASSTLPVTLGAVFDFISASARIGPVAPTLSAATTASGSIALSWSAGPASTTRWEYRQQPEGGAWGPWTEIAGSDASPTSHTVTGLNEDVRYSFQLRAITAGDASPPSATTSAVAGLTPTVPSDRKPLFYDDPDSDGGATQPGSYAFLTDADDLTSGATTFADVSGAVALLLNASGYAGRDYADADVLATVQSGERITWRFSSNCWYSYRVVQVLTDPPAPARKLFKIALDSEDPWASPRLRRLTQTI